MTDLRRRLLPTVLLASSSRSACSLATVPSSKQLEELLGLAKQAAKEMLTAGTDLVDMSDALVLSNMHQELRGEMRRLGQRLLLAAGDLEDEINNKAAVSISVLVRVGRGIAAGSWRENSSVIPAGVNRQQSRRRDMSGSRGQRRRRDKQSA